MLYYAVTELSFSAQGREFIMSILFARRDAKLLSSYDVNSITRDLQVAEYTRELFSGVVETVMQQVCNEVTECAASLDARFENASEEIVQVASDVVNIKYNMERVEKIQLYANLVRLVVSMVPIVDTTSMVVLDSSLDVVFSLDRFTPSQRGLHQIEAAAIKDAE